MTVAAKFAPLPDLASGKIITFPKGIPGFENYTTFSVFHKQENDVAAYWLESTEEPKITFTLVDPTVYDLHYELHLDDDEQEVLQAQGPENCAVFLMLSKKNGTAPAQSLNANIAGPLVVNVETRLGLQKVVSRSRLKVSIVEG